MTAPRRSLLTEFLRGPAGRLHLTTFPCDPPRRSPVVVIQPFAEEAAKSRRLVALAGRALAREGAPVVVPDLTGCGDSEGDFGDATWTAWLADIAAVLDHTGHHHGERPVLLGVRLGALLARAAVASGAAVDRLLFWQPVPSGETLLTQFLRLRVAGDMGTAGGETVADLRQRLQAGESLEVAGYCLAPDLALPMAEARLDPPPGEGRAAWLAIARSAQVPPAVARQAETWSAAGWATCLSAVAGDAFWSAQELVHVPGLAEATVSAVVDLAGGPS